MAAPAAAAANTRPMNLRYSIAPRVLDNSLPMSSLVSNSRFSVRVAPPSASPPSNPSNILSTFIWRDKGSRVFLTGSFDNWRKHQMLFVPDIGYHILVTELPPGNYFYRFIVDGRYRVVDDDPNLRDDPFGEKSHYVTISASTAAAAPNKRFSSVTIAQTAMDNTAQADTALDKGDSDTESESDPTEFSEVEEAPMPPEPRQRGSVYIRDYDDDVYAGHDLQADVFEAIKDVAEKNASPRMRENSPSRSHSTHADSSRSARARARPGRRMLRRIWGMLFGDGGNTADDENVNPNDDGAAREPTSNQRLHGVVTQESALKKGLKVWFPNEKTAPKQKAGRKVAPAEAKDVIDAGDRALKLHQVEENANNRQMLGKNLFAQGKYDAALALFSLSVKLREDNGLKYAKTTAIAHTDVASAFIHLEDLKNAEKHLRKALAIYDKGTFSGGRAQLGDVHCFLGVTGDMRGDLIEAADSYRKAIELYEKCKAVDDNPNYATAIENLNDNLRRQRALPRDQWKPVVQTARAKANEQPQAAQPQPAPQAAPPQQRAAQQVAQAPVAQAPPAAPQQTQHNVQARAPAKPPTRAPKPLEASRPPPRVNTDSVAPPVPVARGPAKKPLEASRPAPAQPAASPRHSTRPDTWKGLAAVARASMPRAPPVEAERPASGANEDGEEDEDDVPAAGSYEEMCRSWHADGRQRLGEGKYEEAKEMYTLAIYTRKRHGPWRTRENAETLVEFARGLFAMRELDEAVGMLRDAIDVLEKLGGKRNQTFLAEVWGNLGSVLDRVGGKAAEALTAHTAGMVVYGKAGMEREDVRWAKAWKALCVNLKMSGKADESDEVWRSIDMQIRGVQDVTKSANVVLHR